MMTVLNEPTRVIYHFRSCSLMLLAESIAHNTPCVMSPADQTGCQVCVAMCLVLTERERRRTAHPSQAILSHAQLQKRDQDLS